MFEILLVIYLLVSLALVGLVLIQHGKGADMGASFGSGSSQTVFGASGSGNFLTRTTALLATVFFVLSLVLGNLSASHTKRDSQFDDLSIPAAETVEQTTSDVPDVNSVSSDDVPQ